MDDHTYNNWVKIKETFEASGNLDNMFYKRACEDSQKKICKNYIKEFFNKKWKNSLKNHLLTRMKKMIKTIFALSLIYATLIGLWIYWGLTHAY